MVIQHNMCAMNTGRQWKQKTGRIAKSAEKLSSGYKVNRSADDAAGLGISEKMRWQIRGLRRASENIEDGVSLCQIADGALDRTVEILQRMRELAVQSANGTNSESDRQNLEDEVAQLRCEIDRIAQTTEFNTKIYPLNASATSVLKPGTGDPDPPDIPPGPDVPDIPDTPPAPAPDEGIIKEKTLTFRTSKACNYDGKTYAAGEMITVTGLTTNGSEIWINRGCIYEQGVWGSGGPSDKIGTLKKSDLNVDSRGYIYYVDLSGTRRYAFLVTDPSHLAPFTGQYGNPDPIHFSTEADSVQSVKDGWAHYMKATDLYDKDPTKPPDPDPPKPSGEPLLVGDPIIIQAGNTAQMANRILIYTVNATCKGLGITDVAVDPWEKAMEAIDLIDKGLSIAVGYRSMFGAVQNRLERAELINDNTAENTQSAESKMRDTDMALEMVQYSSMHILAQACQSMLAQANQSNQRVLHLIA